MAEVNLREIFASSRLCLESMTIPDPDDITNPPAIDENYIRPAGIESAFAVFGLCSKGLSFSFWTCRLR